MMSSEPIAPSGDRGHRAPAGEGNVLREQLMSAAEARIAGQGFAGMSLRQVARDVGVSATSVYLHFASKEALAVAVCNRCFGRLGEFVTAAIDGADGAIEKLSAAGRTYIDFGLNHPEQYAVMFGRIPLEDVLQHVPMEDLAGLDVLDLITQTIAAGIASGELRSGDPTVLAYTMWSLVHGAVGVILHSGPLTPDLVLAERIDSIIELAVRGIIAS